MAEVDKEEDDDSDADEDEMADEPAPLPVPASRRVSAAVAATAAAFLGSRAPAQSAQPPPGQSGEGSEAPHGQGVGDGAASLSRESSLRSSFASTGGPSALQRSPSFPVPALVKVPVTYYGWTSLDHPFLPYLAPPSPARLGAGRDSVGWEIAGQGPCRGAAGGQGAWDG